MSGQTPNGQPPTASGQNTSLNLPGKRGSGYDLQKLRSIHHLILRLAATGMQQNEIARLLNVSEATVNYTVNSELGQQKLAVMQGKADVSTIDVLEQYNELAPVMVELMEQIALSPGEKTADRLRAAENILGGAGFGKRERVDVYQHGVSDEDIAEARKRARERGKNAGIIIEDAKVVKESNEKK